MINAKYDTIGIDYATQRRSDPKIAAQFHAKLQGATRILNIGAGAGSYEPAHLDLVAVEPSQAMIAQRPVGAHPVVQASAEELPFADKQFSHTISILSMHHWEDRKKAFVEINRVTTHQFTAISWNPAAAPFWLTKDYFPEIYEADLKIFPSVAEIEAHFDQVEISPLLIPYDCQDGFLAAYWQRPQAYLDPRVRQSISTFSKLPNVSVGLEKLANDLKSGQWERQHQSLLQPHWFDAGYIIIQATIA